MKNDSKFAQPNHYKKIAQITVQKYASGFSANDDFVQSVADDILDGDFRYDGLTSQDTWRINQAKYAILNNLKKRKKDKHVFMNAEFFDNHVTSDYNGYDPFSKLAGFIGVENAAIFYAHVVEDLSIVDIAKSMGISRQAVHKRYIDSKKRLEEIGYNRVSGKLSE